MTSIKGVAGEHKKGNIGNNDFKNFPLAEVSETSFNGVRSNIYWSSESIIKIYEHKTFKSRRKKKSKIIEKNAEAIEDRVWAWGSEITKII